VVEWVIEVRRETDLAVGLELGQEEGLVGRELGYEVVVTNLGPHEARGWCWRWNGWGGGVGEWWRRARGIGRRREGRCGVRLGRWEWEGGGVLAVVRAMEDGVLTNVVRVVSGELDLVPENNVVEGRVMVERLVDWE
jgi:hypothetical protein